MNEVKSDSDSDAPIVSPSVSLPEITARSIILGIILTIILAAANAYLGLKVGVTVSASIPAAVISMGILRFFRNANILENTMVQIMASVGEAITAGIAFILPALIMLHAWDRFNYWQTVITSLLGGTLGVLFTVPLRRALLKDKSLRYPEAVAIANVLKSNEQREAGDLNALVKGGFVGGLIALCQSGFQALSDTFQFWVKLPSTIVGFSLGFSPALIAAGYIVGINVSLSLIVGLMLGWIIGIPVLSNIYTLPANLLPDQAAMLIWKDHIRYIGVGAMMVGGIWTLCTLFKPLVKSMTTSFQTLKRIRLGEQPEHIRTEHDIPINYVFIVGALLLIPIFCLVAFSVLAPQLSSTLRYTLSAISTLYIAIGGFAFCSIMAYFAGLIGSTNSPTSGLLVCALLIISLIFMLVLQAFGIHAQEAIGTVAAIGSVVIIGVAIAIANDTMQDLKVGQIVGATPWKQQVMLIAGVLVSSFVIPPILQLLYNAYGIGGVFPHPGMNPAHMLAAPQAGLMATVAQGVFSHHLPWAMISLGALIAIICVTIDEYLKREYGTRLPVLGVGLGIYLPLESSVPVIIGGLLAYLVQSRLEKRYAATQAGSKKIQRAMHRGLLIACGMVAGASVMGVILAIPFALKESSDALRLMPDSLMSYTGIISLVVTTLLCVWIYREVMKDNKK